MNHLISVPGIEGIRDQKAVPVFLSGLLRRLWEFTRQWRGRGGEKNPTNFFKV
jgi:hypothetical protein